MKYKALLNAEFELQQPFRGVVKRVLTIAAETSDLPMDTRIRYAQNAGIMPVDSEDGNSKVWKLNNTYNQYSAIPELGKALLVGFPTTFNEDEINEGEVNRAFMDFMKRREGI
jgi:hypothetical protein